MRFVAVLYLLFCSAMGVPDYRTDAPRPAQRVGAPMSSQLGTPLHPSSCLASFEPADHRTIAI